MGRTERHRIRGQGRGRRGEGTKKHMYIYSVYYIAYVTEENRGNGMVR